MIKSCNHFQRLFGDVSKPSLFSIV